MVGKLDADDWDPAAAASCIEGCSRLARVWAFPVRTSIGREAPLVILGIFFGWCAWPAAWRWPSYGFPREVRVHVVASKQAADQTVLETASPSDAYVISNDRFRDFTDKPAVSGQRLIRHEIVAGKVLIHDLNLAVAFEQEGRSLGDRQATNSTAKSCRPTGSHQVTVTHGTWVRRENGATR